MASLIPGYEYDIFISYRQKDNKHDGWVTEFVNNLKGELESTFKEEISVYFDINPHDGLLETHDVDASLKEKLKCLIFIPIISRTYCDPKSFAWEHEFKAFVEMALKDQFGLRVKLPHGNVASRVLPVRIHDLDAADIIEIESVLGSVLRGIEFIYREPGVNKQLPENDPKYSIQINKVANAIREIILSMKNPDRNYLTEKSIESSELSNTQKKSKTRRKIYAAIVVLSAIISGILFIPQLFRDQQEKSIAVLPFYNDTPGDSTNFLNGIMADVIDNLLNIKKIRVCSRTSSSQYESHQRPTMAEIGRRLNVNYIVEASGQKNGKKLLLRIHLYKADNERHLWSNKFEQEITNVEDYEKITTGIVNGIAESLKIPITTEENDLIENIPTRNLDALDYYRRGLYYYWKAGETGETDIAIRLFRTSITYDPEFALAYAGIANAFLDQYFFYKDRTMNTLERSKQAIDSAFLINPHLPEAHMALGNYYYVKLMYDEALKEFNSVLKSKPDSPEANFWTACVYRRSGNWEKAKPLFIRAVKLDPHRIEFLIDLAETYSMLRQYDSAEYFFQRAIIMQPDWLTSYYGYIQMVLSKTGDPLKSERLVTDAFRNENAKSDQYLIDLKVRIDLMKSDYSDAFADLSLLKADAVSNQGLYKPKYLYYAEIYRRMGKEDLARAYFDSSRISLERFKTTADHRYLRSLGISFAGLGMYDQAVLYGEEAAKILPPERDALKGIDIEEDLARIYLMKGDVEIAIEKIKNLLSAPGHLSVELLESDPFWEPLRNNPKYRKLVQEYKKF